MEVKLVTLLGADVPESMREKGLSTAYQVTSYDGAVTVFETGSEAAQYASRIHKQHRFAQGLDDERDN
ncbi:hypothetical protein [Pseudomonas sp. PS01301]|uniref:hypothetical protein n=1 Tax=Pseudomonas sp. PS01301 TaxID=2991437 RepID=UPI00107066AE|nr:hypothetical protein [Pseudomonas sp. PS01301]